MHGPEPDLAHENGRLWVAGSPPPAHSEALAGQLRHALERCDTLQTELAEARARLASLHLELNGTRAGERRAHHLANHDSLTGLPNQRFFHQRLTQVLAAWTPAPPEGTEQAAPCVVFLDLDGFKRVNDSHGHAAGDALLQAVAKRLTTAVRTGDLVARMGGDEFACLLEGPVPHKQLNRLAHKLFAAVAAPLTLPAPRLGKVTLAVVPSIGVSQCPQDGTSVATLLAAADAAMYQAKRAHAGVAFASASAPLG